MAFKEKFKVFTDTVSAKSSEMAQKAKDMAEVASLNSKIKTQKEGINAAYLAIGKEVFLAQKDSADTQFGDQIQAIKEKLAQIEELEKNISAIKGTKKCANCGKEISVHAEVCPKCNKPCDEKPETE